jgi:hypothetical protein
MEVELAELGGSLALVDVIFQSIAILNAA